MDEKYIDLITECRLKSKNDFKNINKLVDHSVLGITMKDLTKIQVTR